MALQYPGSAAIPQYGSSLAAFMPAFEKGQTERKDANAIDAAARVFGGGQPAPQQPQGALASLMGQAPQTPQQPMTPLGAIEAATPLPAGIPESAWQTIASIPTTGSNIPAGYMASARAAESGGNDAAANPNSSATGRYQFLQGTWSDLMSKYPELGLTPDGRTDGAQQERAMERFTQDNARALSNAGIPINPGNLYAAHFLGAGGASKVLTQDPSSPLSAYLDPGVIAANPNLQGMTVGDFTNWTQQKGGNQSGGYQAPMQDVGAGQGQAYNIDPQDIATLMASEATRPLAMSLIQAKQQEQASQGRFVTEQGEGGAIFQRDTLTGETKVLMTPDQAKVGGDETFFGNPVPYQDENGNIKFGQIGNKGTFKPIDIGGEGQFVSPTKTVNTETEQIVMDQFGNVLSRIPINNRESAYESGFGSVEGKTDAENAALAESVQRKMPGLRSVIETLATLADTATYTQSGQAMDAVKRELGLPVGQGAIDRASYIAIVDNQVLPLLKDTFGAAFTVQEGESLRATLGDPNKSPAEKKSILDAFIAQKERDVATMQQSTRSPSAAQSGATATNPQTGERLQWDGKNWVSAP